MYIYAVKFGGNVDDTIEIIKVDVMTFDGYRLYTIFFAAKKHFAEALKVTKSKTLH